jgi:hypothetical protein
VVDFPLIAAARSSVQLASPKIRSLSNALHPQCAKDSITLRSLADRPREILDLIAAYLPHGELRPVSHLFYEINTPFVVFKVKNIKQLEYLATNITNLRQLDLSQCEDLDDNSFSKVSEFKRLQYLNVKDRTGIINLTPLVCLSHLQYLDLSFCENIDDLSPLENLRNLRYLDLTAVWHQRIKNIDMLKGLSNLETLIMRFCTNIWNFEGINLLEKIQFISVYGCNQITNLKVFMSLHGLKEFDVSQCSHIPASEIQMMREKILHCRIVSD